LPRRGAWPQTIAHEINNPLEAVVNLLFLLRSTVNPDGIRFLAAAESELARVSSIQYQSLLVGRTCFKSLQIPPSPSSPQRPRFLCLRNRTAVIPDCKHPYPLDDSWDDCKSPAVTYNMGNNADLSGNYFEVQRAFELILRRGGCYGMGFPRTLLAV
jgi:hypothetical protein